MAPSTDRATRSAMRWVAWAVMSVVACSALAACSPSAGSVQDQASSPPATSASPDPTTPSVLPSFAAVGDSITDANSPDLPGGDLGTESWTTYVVAAGFEFAGGWAEWGAPTSLMADSVTAYDADVLVLLAGTNDVALGRPFAESAANLDRIVATVGIDAVVVSSIPPMDALPDGAAQYNAQLESLAADRGWRFVDASAGLRTADGRFLEGMSYDGLHPTEQGARVLGEGIAAVLPGS